MQLSQLKVLFKCLDMSIPVVFPSECLVTYSTCVEWESTMVKV